jgi:hypothetical protein
MELQYKRVASAISIELEKVNPILEGLESYLKLMASQQNTNSIPKTLIESYNELLKLYTDIESEK